MESDNPRTRSYLLELFKATEGNLEAETSMYDIGAAIGMERGESGSLAEELIVEGWVELRTLSGGISITTEGLRVIDVQAAGSAQEALSLGNDRVMPEQALAAVAELIKEVETEVSQGNMTYEQVAEIVIDIKTLQVQLLSSQPKTSVIREIFRSISYTLSRTGEGGTAAKIVGMINS